MADFVFACPAAAIDDEQIVMAHGGGGRMMHRLLNTVFLPAFNNPALAAGGDGAALAFSGGRLAFTTDSYVVRPLFFPGGDIGALAVNGTVNDLAMCGARPLYLSAGFILEEGLPIDTLRRVVASMAAAAAAASVQIVTGDTKVIDAGRGDGLYINTAGIGVIDHERLIAPASIQVGDIVLLNGDLGRHSMAIMAVREGLSFESEIKSDCAPLAADVLALLDAGIEIHCLRDLTRGGLASALVELAIASGRSIEIDERAIPVREDVRGACELLGLDPLYAANEGRFIAIVAPRDAARARAMLGEGARCIGHVTSAEDTRVTLISAIGAPRWVEMMSGEQLPRIC